MLSTSWIDRRRPYWQRLDLLCTRARSGVRALDRSELQELGLLYRQIAADLATAREDPSSVRTASALNQLLARAHHTIYSADRPRRASPLEFFTRTFPGAVRSNARMCAIAVALFASGAGVAATLTLKEPAFKNAVLSPAMIATIDRREMWTHSIVAVKPVASSAIMTNNLSVAFTTFAAGITAGVGTGYLLIYNGVLLGAIAAACGAAGMSTALWSFVAPHGVIELSAIFISAAGGLRLAQGLLFPGFLPRRISLAVAGRSALTLVIGCIPMLVLAGVIEAFVSPTELAVPLKFAMAAAFGVLLTVYFSTCGADRRRTSLRSGSTVSA